MARTTWRRKLIRKLVSLPVVLWLAFALPTGAWAHPLGNFTINHYAGLEVSRTRITVDYVLDMAEIPAFQEIGTFDANGNGLPDPTEASAYHAAKCLSTLEKINLQADGQPLSLSLVSSGVSFPAGAGGLPTLRLTCTYGAPLAGQAEQISFSDEAYAERIGWREIVVIADGVSLAGVPTGQTHSLSNRLTSYPKDMLTSPLDQREITFGLGTSAPVQSAGPAAAPSATVPLGDRNDRFTRLILLENLTLPAVLAALAVSFLWGALHAMTPGHGKTIVGAYLVGSRGTPAHALYLGLTTTITHTLGVFALGLITYFAARFIVPDRLYPWMSFLSGLFVVGMGANLMLSRYRSSGLGNWLKKLPRVVRDRNTRLAVLSVSGYTPAENGASRHQYVFSRPGGAHGGHSHGPGLHVHPAGHHHDSEHVHGAAHSHLPPGAEGAGVTWRSLLLLGISGGILPCPSALVVLLGAIALNRIGFGLVLVLAFSLGLAGALTLIGLLFIYAGRLFGRIPAQGAIVRFVPMFSALFIALIGIGITLRALEQIGVLRL